MKSFFIVGVICSKSSNSFSKALPNSWKRVREVNVGVVKTP